VAYIFSVLGDMAGFSFDEFYSFSNLVINECMVCKEVHVYSVVAKRQAIVIVYSPLLCIESYRLTHIILIIAIVLLKRACHLVII